MKSPILAGVCLIIINFCQAQQLKSDSLYGLLLKNKSDSFLTAQFHYHKGYEAFLASQYDSALYFLHQAAENAMRLKNDTLSIKSLNLAGDAYSDKGDNPQALKCYQEAVLLARKSGNREMEARIIKNIGVLYVSWQKLPQALSHYDSALRIARQIGNMLLETDCKNNIGVVYEISEDYPKAIAYYMEALDYYSKIGKKESVAMVYSNLAIAYKYSGELSKSIEYNLKSLELAREMKDKWKEAAITNNIGSAYLRMNNPELAYDYALNAVNLSKKISAKEIELNAYQTLSEASYAMGRFKEATDHLRAMMVVKDSFINLESTRQVAELQTKFESVQREQLIQKQQFDLQKKNFQLGGIILMVTFFLMLGVSYFRREKLKQEKDKKEQLLHQQEEATRAVLNAEESERKRIAAELHDGVGQLMSAARMNLEAAVQDLKPLEEGKLIKLERVVDLVDESCREVRAVSHSMMPNALLKKGLSNALYDFIQKIDQNIIKTNIHIEGLGERLAQDVESIVYRIMQECIHNVIKHSKASQLEIALIKDENHLDISIEDNGVGFDPSELSDGIGLQNIKARVLYLKGSIDIDSTPGKGTFIGIHIPVE